ncbi:MAG: hypothetical protein LBE92_17230 [Chryseobacterium sp.]|jgi:hypothetical protein|uniref:hypothetical protein n=1 Tax=Chryseobacterium sp. TaxID=1871047 RepID=UPI00283888A9|nr:hypothetical protein [Chryseobacterium sp.]MDR2237869.1 hypothetical protein [Chryseobacterium sp.]
MSTGCHTAPSNKKEYIADIGKILVQEYGTQKYYKPEEVKTAHQKSKWYDGLDFSCWAMSVYSSHSDFTGYHQQTGEICDYTAMKTAMLQGISVPTGSGLPELPDADIDSSWLDFGEVFGNILEGIGDFIGGIFDGF